MNVVLGWLLLAMVVGLATMAKATVPRRWGGWGLVLIVALTIVPPVFTGFALAKFGVHLLGGAS